MMIDILVGWLGSLASRWGDVSERDARAGEKEDSDARMKGCRFLNNFFPSRNMERTVHKSLSIA
eukprot:scaffold9386_cov87-Skeletonema_menzelii.AAC.5